MTRRGTPRRRGVESVPDADGIVRTLLWRADANSCARARRSSSAIACCSSSAASGSTGSAPGASSAAVPDRRGPRREDRPHAGLRRARRRWPPRASRPEAVAAAAFFDLDRTLLRRSSALALAGSFRERGFISRRQLAQAAAWQLLFVARGASHEAVRRGAEDGLRILAGHRPEELRELVAEALEPVLRPLVYAEPLRLVEQHRERGERVFVVSATLQEIVEAIADDLGFDGALGTICEVRGRPLHRSRRCGRCTPKQRPTACARSPRARVSTSRSARRTPTATPTSPSSKPSGIRSPSIRTASCGALRGTAGGRCSSSAGARTRMRAAASRRRSSSPGSGCRGARRHAGRRGR